MPAQLLALTEGPNILLDKPIMLFGRHPECDIQLNSRKVSRRHCCIAQVHDYLVIRDLGSTNGIRINGERVLEGKLHAGDEVTIGNYRYQVCWNQNDAPVPTPRAKAVRSLDDAMLEEADEPIPLDHAPPGKILTANPVTPPPGRIIIGDSSLGADHLTFMPRSGDLRPPT